MTTMNLEQTTAPDAEETKLRKMAMEFEATGDFTTDEENAVDRGDRDPEPDEQGQQSQQRKQAKTDSDTALPASDADKDKGKTDTETDTAKPKPEPKKDADGAPESPYAKKQRELSEERKRLDESWKKLEREKAETRAQALEQTRFREARERDRQSQAPARPVRLAHKYPVAELEAMARDLDRRGETALADKAWEEVEEAQAFAARGGRPGQAETTRAPAPESPPATMGPAEFQERWKAHLEVVTAENPALRQKDSPLYQGTAQVLQEFGFLSRMPDGIRHAVEVTKLRLAAKAVPELERKLAEVQKENGELRQATSLSGGNGEPAGKAKTFADMNDAEQEAYVRRMAEEANSQGMLA